MTCKFFVIANYKEINGFLQKGLHLQQKIGEIGLIPHLIIYQTDTSVLKFPLIQPQLQIIKMPLRLLLIIPFIFDAKKRGRHHLVSVDGVCLRLSMSRLFAVQSCSGQHSAPLMETFQMAKWEELVMFDKRISPSFLFQSSPADTKQTSWGITMRKASWEETIMFSWQVLFGRVHSNTLGLFIYRLSRH